MEIQKNKVIGRIRIEVYFFLTFFSSQVSPPDFWGFRRSALSLSTTTNNNSTPNFEDTIIQRDEDY